jgi:glycosyltransferase involved in cell wall biosynthesis
MTSHATFQAKPGPDLILCLSHLRWDLVWQRPHHLMSRAARDHLVAYVEEPVMTDDGGARLVQRRDPSGVIVLTPALPRENPEESEAAIRRLIDDWLSCRAFGRLILWYYTPMALGLARDLSPDVQIYDCMDELSAFDFAPPELREREEALLAGADLVFAGGRSLHEARLDRRPDARLFPSSVDARHFGAARTRRADPADQRSIGRPRVGFFGVIDERMDLGLVESTAQALPDVQFVMLGPVVKIDPAELPRLPNIHWLGPKRYEDLPDYLANWNAGWMPFALNRSTRFISPTKTPEFLAAGLQVVSTAVPDVVRSYGEAGLVLIADLDGMPDAVRSTLTVPPQGWLDRVDACLAETSWDATWAAMRRCIREVRPALPTGARATVTSEVRDV